MTDNNRIERKLTHAYRSVLDELSLQRYRTFSVGEFFIDHDGKPDSDVVNVVVRIDVDNALHLEPDLARELSSRGIHAAHYFLTDPELHYAIWGSGIPHAVAAENGQEVGLHSDHLYIEKIRKVDGLTLLKDDVVRLSEEAGVAIRGACFHGHEAINQMGCRNWDLTADIESSDLGLEYHDGRKSCYIKPGSRSWVANADIRISDFFGFPGSWGWNYHPAHPIRLLRRARPGEVVHVAFHTKNAYEYWKNWNLDYGEKPMFKEPLWLFLKKAILIRLRPITSRMRMSYIKDITVRSFLWVTAYFLSRVIGRVVSKFTKEKPRDVSWSTGRQRIVDLGIPYWRNHLEVLGMTAPGGRVVEIGSGNGQWLVASAEDAEEVVGYEPADHVREWSKKFVEEFKDRRERIKIHNGAAEVINLPNDYSDVVLCLGVFMFTDQHKALQEMSRILKPGGKICLTVNGLGYFLMYMRSGIRSGNYSQTHYGLRGVLATLLKWWRKSDLPYSKAVNVAEMEAMMKDHGLVLDDVRLWLAMPLYPKEHYGFPTNYAFIAHKQETNKGDDDEK